MYVCFFNNDHNFMVKTCKLKLHLPFLKGIHPMHQIYQIKIKPFILQLQCNVGTNQIINRVFNLKKYPAIWVINQSDLPISQCCGQARSMGQVTQGLVSLWSTWQLVIFGAKFTGQHTLHYGSLAGQRFLTFLNMF